MNILNSRNNDFDLEKLKVEAEDVYLHSQGGSLYRNIVEAVERPLIERVLDLSSGNQLKAAQTLGINRNTLSSKIKRLGIDPRRFKR